MKKLVMFMVIVVFAAFSFSCGSDDKPQPTPEGDNLVLTSDAKDVVPFGTVVNFVVKQGGRIINDAVITTADGVIVKGSEYKVFKEGVNSFKAKKEGFKDSNVLDLKVLEIDAKEGHFEWTHVKKVVEKISKVELTELSEEVNESGTKYKQWYIEFYVDYGKYRYSLSFLTPMESGKALLPTGDNMVFKNFMAEQRFGDTDDWSITQDYSDIEVVIDLELIKESESAYRGKCCAEITHMVNGEKSKSKVNYKGNIGIVNKN